MLSEIAKVKLALVWLAQSDDDGITDETDEGNCWRHCYRHGVLCCHWSQNEDQVTSQPTPTLDQHSHGWRHTRRQTSARVRDRLGPLGFSSMHDLSIRYCWTLYSALRVAILVVDTYPVVQRESISCVPRPDESVAAPVAPKMKTPEPPLNQAQSQLSTVDFVSTFFM